MYLIKFQNLIDMITIEQLREAINEGIPLVWNDPNPIKINDYTITYIENIDVEEFDDSNPILIKYNHDVSEAEVYLHEIIYK